MASRQAGLRTAACDRNAEGRSRPACALTNLSFLSERSLISIPACKPSSRTTNVQAEESSRRSDAQLWRSPKSYAKEEDAAKDKVQGMKDDDAKNPR